MKKSKSKKSTAKAKLAAKLKANSKSVKKRTSPTFKIGIFGGTFNPIHYGHLNSLERVQKEFGFKKMLIVPVAKNPLRDKTEGPSAIQRLEMAKRILPLLNHQLPEGQDQTFEVRDNEVVRGGDSYTIDSLKEFKKEFPKAELNLIIGADQLDTFNQWKDYKGILKIANLVVTSRPGAPLPLSKAEMPKWLAEQVVLFKNQKASLKSKNKLIFYSLVDVDISATLIRRKVRNNENISSFTPSVVTDYILEQKLYKEVENRIGEFRDFTQFCVTRLEEKGGLTILAYDLRGIEQPTEFSIATSGTSTRHSRALAEHIMQSVKDQYGVYPQSTEGLQEGRWIVLDYGSLMVHIFYEYVRNEYRIEELWRQGKVLNLTTPPPNRAQVRS